ncbi:hypothetical protein ON010_g7295 [Phytophthora cinnamomi]|nr:hypothetical protein ON010_g7295 [Phytophthora cinnamomi]
MELGRTNSSTVSTADHRGITLTAKHVMDFSYYGGGRRCVPQSVQLDTSIFDDLSIGLPLAQPVSIEPIRNGQGEASSATAAAPPFSMDQLGDSDADDNGFSTEAQTYSRHRKAPARGFDLASDDADVARRLALKETVGPAFALTKDIGSLLKTQNPFCVY